MRLYPPKISCARCGEPIRRLQGRHVAWCHLTETIWCPDHQGVAEPRIIRREDRAA